MSAKGASSPAPLLDTDRHIAWTALAVCLVAAVAVTLAVWPAFTRSLGDTDDALRLVMVRELLSGGGWYDQEIRRLQPPLGVQMHWSRLVDAGEAMALALLQVLLPRGAAETVLRLAWPLAWMGPAVLAALRLARALRPDAVFVCALLLATNFAIYRQFAPGRIDHHNIQLALCLIAVAAAAWPAQSIRTAITAAMASGLCLAVGLEALPFLALVGGAYGGRWVLDPGEARPARAYGLALAGTAFVAFLIQTPPWRWGLSVCDALGLNLTLGLVIAGLGLGAASFLRGRLAFRMIGVGAAGLVAAGVYLALHPACLGGPMAEIDPALFPLWLDHVNELRPWPRLLAADPKAALTTLAPLVLGLGAVAWLARDPARRREPGFVLLTLCLLGAVLSGFVAVRAAGFGAWLAMPLIAAALADLAARRLDGKLVPTVVLALVVSPFVAALLAGALAAPFTPRADRARQAALPAALAAQDRCFATAAFAPLKLLPPGLALAPIDLGPHLLAHTRLSALAAPYHRMAYGIAGSYALLAASPAEAESQAAALGVDYVVHCQGLADSADAGAFGPGSLKAALDDGRAPAWLERVSPPGAALAVYRVRPVGFA